MDMAIVKPGHDALTAQMEADCAEARARLAEARANRDAAYDRLRARGALSLAGPLSLATAPSARAGSGRVRAVRAAMVASAAFHS